MNKHCWKLFLDDQLFDDHVTERVRRPIDYVGADNSTTAMSLVEYQGLPTHMMLDFDFGIVNGVQDSAEVFLKWLQNKFPNGPIPEYTVHSKNIIGQKWIHDFMSSWKRSLEK